MSDQDGRQAPHPDAGGMTRDPVPREAALPRKRPYEKPSFRFEGVFETTALACGKANTNQGQCKFVKKHS